MLRASIRGGVVNRLYIVGAGGHGCVVAEAAGEQGCWREISFLDDVRVQPVHDIGILIAGRVEEFERLVGTEDEFIVAIGENADRLEISTRLRAIGRPALVLANSAVISPSARIAAGSVVLPGAVINAGCAIAEDCIVNTGATVDHGVVLGQGVHVSPGVNLGGDVSIGDRSWIGIGASVSNGVQIGEDVCVGAGAVVVGDLEEAGTYVGVPAIRLDP